MQNKLLPCPFCSSEVKWRSGAIVCDKCNLEFRKTPNAELNINAWNTRKPMERIVEQLECLYKYNSEQATLYHDMEKQDAHTREMKDLYIDRTNCYGVAIRTVKGGVDNG